MRGWLTVCFIGGFLMLPIVANASALEKLPDSKSTNSSPAKAIVVTKKNPTFIVRLASNPTTGYQWYLKEYPQQIMEIKSSQYLRKNTEIMGAKGEQIFRFKIKRTAFRAPQIYELKFVYAQSWQLSNVKLKSIHVVIHERE